MLKFRREYIGLLIALFFVSIFSGSALAQTGGSKPCEQCGMSVDSTGQERFKIIDATGGQHIACCIICAFKLIPKYGELNITAFCDYNGPSYPIAIKVSQNGTGLTLYPQTALAILGGGCTKNRLVYDSVSADALLAPPNNGMSIWLPMMDNVTVAANATRMTIAKAVLQYAGGVNSSCEQCGMTVDVTGQQRFRIFDATGTVHVACCPVCALRLQRTYNNLNVTSFCDYNGPNYPITIVTKNNGTEVTVTPSDALIISAGSCTKNRIVYNSTAADLLLAPPSNGTSKYLSPLQNATAASNATRLSIVQAALINGAGVPSPTPTLSPSPTPTLNPVLTPTPTPPPTVQPTTPATTIQPTPTLPTLSPTKSPETSNSPVQTAAPTLVVTESPSTTINPTPGIVQTQTCEVCGMDVSPAAQARYVATDGNGNFHYVECFMCALHLLNKYDQVTISTYCDWYGQNYPIVVQSSQNGKEVTVTPSTAMFLSGGSCVTNRAAYNQTAVDELLINGYSSNTLQEQQYALPTSTNVTLVKDSALTYAGTFSPSTSQTPLLLIVAVVIGVAIVVAAMVAFRKLKQT